MQENLNVVIPKLYALAFASSCLDTEHTKNVALDISIFSFLGVMQHGLVFVKGSGAFKKSNDTIRLVITTLTGMIFGYFIGIFFPSVSLNKINLHSSIVSSLDVAFNNDHSRSISNHIPETRVSTDKAPPKIYVPTNPRGAESLPPAIVVSQSDFYLRRLWGEPSEDLTMKPKYLVTFTVGLDQRNNIDAAVKKFSEDFQIMLFHYDGWTSEWDQFEWSKRAIHVSVRKQTKWWYAKRFLHPDIIAVYEYIFIWDEDLGVEHFNGDKFVEIMAPVFSREAWRCVWHMIQNDLVHGWGLDFALRRCVEPAHEEIGVVDSQWVVHQVIPSLGNQKDVRSNEATMKYLLMGGASSSILVHGFSWLYGSSGGEIELQEIVNGLINTQMYNSPRISIALIFITVGIGFKLSPAPSHQWTPDVYEGVRFVR
ncbi:hypothetical protein TEA_010453 [Camellia sinensis var. sinensis]|uniref:NADH:quinone oxidoreductase/Mrp antiporter transmembrane domain-containing protein n=1 Tax=Camellia sinensis var. sinensis TaxID=542762 RepID=A0A4S4EHF0_CAMSN|nr:hypothetical protein TEA_010453 [Camellia sinensis var. sinensis]